MKSEKLRKGGDIQGRESLGWLVLKLVAAFDVAVILLYGQGDVHNPQKRVWMQK